MYLQSDNIALSFITWSTGLIFNNYTIYKVSLCFKTVKQAPLYEYKCNYTKNQALLADLSSKMKHYLNISRIKILKLFKNNLSLSFFCFTTNVYNFDGNELRL